MSRPSPLQNRVTPGGEIVAVGGRGGLMGNRGGRLHERGGWTLGGRRWVSRQWICCVLEVPGRPEQNARRAWDHPVRYSELFFLDEPTALAAGHRPCFECRRRAAEAFRGALASQERGPPLAAPELDRRLHAERLDGRAKRLGRARADDLPDGAAILLDGAAHMLRGAAALAWSPAGYGPTRRARPRGEVDVLTPPASLAALRGGYLPVWHRSAG
jgi:hypothetical protein